MYKKLIQKLIENSIFDCVLISFVSETDTEIDREFISKMKFLLQGIVTSGNEFPDWKGLIGGGLTRGFAKFDMSSLSVSVSIFDCVLISFVLETDTEIDRELISKLKFLLRGIVTSGNKLPDWKGLIGGGLTRGFTKFDMSSLSVSVTIFD